MRILCSLTITLLLAKVLASPGNYNDPNQTPLSPLLIADGFIPEIFEKTGRYIVVLKDDTSVERFQSIISEVVPMSEDDQLHGSVWKIAKAFTVRLSELALSIVRSLPEVKYVEEETMVQADQHQLPPRPTGFDKRHLDRLDQRKLPLDNIYQPNGTGEGVDIYILDTGVNYDHEEFEKRAVYAGYDPVDVQNIRENMTGRDCHGHGTHVAGLAAGKKYGVAKKAQIYSVRVLGCSGTAPWSVIIDGLDYVSRVIPERGRPAIVSMSFGGPFSATADNAVKKLHSQGIIIVSSAGNERRDACVKTPGGSSKVITVGGTILGGTDGIHFTNVGSCVDIFAPATGPGPFYPGITAADYLCNNCTRYRDGTSVAASLVSGIAAIYLERAPALSPDEMKALLIATSTKDIIDFRQLPSLYKSSTPNRLVYIHNKSNELYSDCEELGNITNGVVSITGVTHGSVATYSCDSGYLLLGAQNQTCTIAGLWSHTEPQCVIPCQKLSTISNGSVTVINPSNPITVGNTAEYSCNRYYLRSGPKYRKCQSNGTWSGAEPMCATPTCPIDDLWPLLQIPRINIYYNNKTGRPVYVAGFNCGHGFEVVGPMNRTCLSNHTWSHGSEISYCKDVGCPVIGHSRALIIGSREVGSVISYVCDDGYEPVGEMNRTCLSNRTWSGEAPLCKDIQCPRVHSLSFGRIEYPRVSTEGSVATWICNDGYVLVGIANRTCQSNLTWSGDEPFCKDIQCPRLNSNSFSNGSIYVPHVRKEGAVATYSCFSGYELVGPASRTCIGNLTWSHGEPVCMEKICPPLFPILNGKIHYVLGRRVGSVVNFTCNNGYELVGPVKRTCLSNGTWTNSQSCCAAVYFEFRGEKYSNNSQIPSSQVGEGDDAVLCKTNKIDCCGLPNRAGEFYYPNGDKVRRKSSGDRLYRNRSKQMVRLNRRNGETKLFLGKYACEIPNAEGKTERIYISLV